ncbi:hypothetical protein Mapa_015971 [Marchantia paleacea]|nr:hypothetical protein Mapa_015971 [Marchantia paleacea]
MYNDDVDEHSLPCLGFTTSTLTFDAYFSLVVLVIEVHDFSLIVDAVHLPRACSNHNAEADSNHTFHGNIDLDEGIGSMLDILRSMMRYF